MRLDNWAGGSAGSYGNRSGLGHALVVQGRVLGALMLRELHTRFGRENVGYLWLFVEPAILGIAVSIIHLISGAHLPNNIGVLEFYLVGYTPFFMLRAVINRAGSAIPSNRPLLYHRQVTVSDILLSRSLLEGAACVLVTLLWQLYLMMTEGSFPNDPLLIVYGIALILWWSHGIGMMVAAAGALSETVDRLTHPLVYLFMPLSGAFFMLDWLPPKMAALLWYNPVVQMYEVIRQGQFGSLVHVNYDVGYMIAHCVIGSILGLAALRAVRPKLVI